ncbi:MAG: hypothetical protein P8Y65_03450 [Campylobacterales bacterium]
MENLFGPELATRLCGWIQNKTPITCIEEREQDNAMGFDIDEAIEFSKIRMFDDPVKREFFPLFVKLKRQAVSVPA